jgi:hypothetical protein
MNVKIVLYDSETMKLIFCLEDALNPIVDGNNVVFDGGELRGISKSLIIVEDDVDVEDNITSALLSFDKQDEFREKSEEDLRPRLEAAEMAIISLMDFM